jgi:hypothetical protein
MKKQRALVVVHSSLVPPDSLEGHAEKEIDEWRTEYDVISTLKRRGHEVRCLGVLDSLTELRSAIADWKPDIVFNLLEEFNGIVTYDQHVVAFLELMRQPYTGCNPRGLLLSRDKSLCKQLLAFHRVPTPQFTVFRRGARFHVPRRLKFPLFVKSTVEDASLGIAQASVVEDADKLKERIEFVHEQVGSDARGGIRRGPRALRGCAWQRPPDAPAGVGDGVRLTAGLACRDRHAQGEVGQALPGALWHHHACGDGSATAGARASGQAVAAHLPCARTIGLRTHGFSRHG